MRVSPGSAEILRPAWVQLRVVVTGEKEMVVLLSILGMILRWQACPPSKTYSSQCKVGIWLARLDPEGRTKEILINKLRWFKRGNKPSSSFSCTRRISAFEYMTVKALGFFPLRSEETSLLISKC
jgi:hypothetical protein